MFRRKLTPAKILRHIEKREPPFLELEIDGKSKALVAEQFRTIQYGDDNLRLQISGFLPKEDNRPIEVHFLLRSQEAEEVRYGAIGRLVNAILQTGVAEGASHISIVTEATQLRVAFVVQSESRDLYKIPLNLSEPLLTRIREMSDIGGPFRDNRGIVQVVYEDAFFDLLVSESEDKKLLRIDIQPYAGAGTN